MDGFATSAKATALPNSAAQATSSSLGNTDRTASSPSRPSVSDTAAVVPGLAPAPLGDGASATQDPVAPSPETVVARSWHVPLNAQERAAVREAMLREEHAEEMARLIQALRDMRQDHAAEIERLRAHHAAEVQRLVEALWHAQDAARAVSAPSECPAERPALDPQPPSQAQRVRSCTWLGRFVGQGAFSHPVRTGASAARIVRRWALAFCAWR